MQGTINRGNVRLKIQESYYLDRIREFGLHSARTVGWTEYLQVILFEKITVLFSRRESGAQHTLLDVGSGLGDFSRYLRDHGYGDIQYNGIEVVKEMAAAAREKFPGVNFRVADFAGPLFADEYDNIITEKNAADYERFVMGFIRKMYDLSRRGCAFNLLCEEGRVFFPDDRCFYYARRETISDYCASFCRDLALDYQEHEFTFTVVMRK
jgi:SAM-dependent methyltransferase